MRTVLSVAAVALVAAVLAPLAAADVNVTDRPYVRHDGGTDVYHLRAAAAMPPIRLLRCWPAPHRRR